MKWVLLVFLLISCTDTEEDMRLFVSSLSSDGGGTPIDTRIPIGISFVSSEFYDTDGGHVGHPQGMAIDALNDMLYVSWTQGVDAYRWSTKTLLNTTAPITDVTEVPGPHIGGICLIDGLVYGSNAIDGYKLITPNTNKIYVFNPDMTVNRTVESEYEYYVGGMAYDKKNGILMGLYGSDLSDNGEIQEIDKTTLLKANTLKQVVDNYSTPTNFGGIIQGGDYFDNPNFLCCVNYTGTPYAGLGGNIVFWDLQNNTYDIIQEPALPTYILGVHIEVDTLYLLKSDRPDYINFTIEQYDIIYAP